MARKGIPAKTIKKVIVKSRRRCCICFGLNRDTSIKQGQIAHLDKDSSNPEIDNLAFLCLDHHDQYDSRRSQSKGFISDEVKEYRNELHDHIWRAFMENHEPIDNDVRAIQGHYIREGISNSAEIKVRHLEGRLYYVDGLALWGTSRDSGPNIGTLEFEAYENEMELIFLDAYRGEEYKAVLSFDGKQLKVVEQGFSGYSGMNVTFEGVYEKA